MNRPKRIHRLPSRFADHSIGPSKFIPIQPCHASTPMQKHKMTNKQSSKIDKKTNNRSPDSNNNPKSIRSTRLKVKPKASSKKLKHGKRLLDKSHSFKILDDKKKSKNGGEKLDVYEFTFDPDEEPQPATKKKKTVVKKKPSKPKTIVYKNNYDKNMSKAIAALKEVVAKYQSKRDPNINKETREPSVQNDPMQTPNVKSAQVQGNKGQTDVQSKQTNSKAIPQTLEIVNPTKNVMQTQLNRGTSNLDAIKQLVNNGNKSLYEHPPSISVEDIEADVGISYHDDMNYSPVNSPRPSSLNPVAVTQDTEDRRGTIENAIFNKDPLNLQDDDSFFDDQPVASSSMNASVRHPLASPWRVEFGSLPIKWPANTYLKPNMTPAVESSFISSEDSNKKKHVYVNMIPQTDDSLPQIVENNATNFKQTSIISFIKEVADRNANKKKRGHSVSPVKASTLFEDITNRSNADIVQRTSKKVMKKAAIGQSANKDTSYSSSNTSNDKENIRQTRKRRKKTASSKLPAKSPHKEKDSNVTYFGFDDSENQDLENVMPNKNIDYNKLRSLRSRSRVLQEINCENKPARVALPAAKTKITSSSEAVKRMYDNLKSAEDAPLFLDKNNHQNAGTTNVEIPQNTDIDNEDCDSVHLFEDIDVVHHLKPTRKSYGKAKKVTFRQRSTSDSETQASDVEKNALSSDEDDLGDLTFTMPEFNQKKAVRKKKTKKIMTKKEEKEADEWAAGFNSMCEDIEEFPLLVE